MNRKKIGDFFKASIERLPLDIWLHNYTYGKVRNIFDAALLPVGLLNSLFLALKAREDNDNIFDGDLACVAIAKNEGQYLQEWINYHQRVIGVDHFYIYDNDSKDSTFNILQPYIEKGIVTYKIIHGLKRQYDSYNDALNRFRYKYRWMIFIDLDEFVYAQVNLKRWLNDKDYGNVGGIVLNWTIFGSSGHMQNNRSYVTERFLHRSKNDFIKNRHIKSICNPRKVIGFMNAHYAVYVPGYYAISTDGDRQYGAFANYHDDVARINHYFTKSAEEFQIKRARGKADDYSIRDEQEFNEHDKNDVYDDGMLKYIGIINEKGN